MQVLNSNNDSVAMAPSITNGDGDNNGEVAAGKAQEDVMQSSPVVPIHPRDAEESVNTAASAVNSLQQQQPQLPQQPRKQARKRHRTHVANICDDQERESSAASLFLLPPNQYEVVLVRRAVRKLPDDDDEDGISSVHSTEAIDNGEQEVEYGDTSLGMKLNIVAGKVIVQHVTALQDGRASPAQLTGNIQRGDALVAVNGRTLVNLPVDQLINSLGPLSTPTSEGMYQKEVTVRLETLSGLSLLLANESADQQRPAQADVVFPLFPMVDQLSGLPMFGENNSNIRKENAQPPPRLETGHNNSGIEEALTSASMQSRRTPRKQQQEEEDCVHSRISRAMAKTQQEERIQAVSGFFAWRGKHSQLLMNSSSGRLVTSEHGGDDDSNGYDSTKRLTREEHMERGQRAVLGAQALTTHVEVVDKGKDVRSFRSWNSSLSLRSQAGSRRLLLLSDTASLPVKVSKVSFSDEEPLASDDQSVHSQASSDVGSVDGDEVLLRLAAHDEIWRRQVLEYLTKIDVDQELLVDNDTHPEAAPPKQSESNVFSNLLFGQNMSRILNKEKRTVALPPADVTAVLFDLTSKISLSVPNEINAAASASVSGHVNDAVAKPKAAVDEKALLATAFLIDEALPAWSKTFRPLPWDQRRAVWPVYRQSYGGSTTASTISDDMMSVNTLNTGTDSAVARQPLRKNIREQVEDQMLDGETREETCFLLTYLFIHSFLPKKNETQGSLDHDSAKAFIAEFGAYLKLHTCLAQGALVEAPDEIDLLLKLARNDPSHREVSKSLSKKGTFVLYEPSMLSAILQRLAAISTEESEDAQNMTIELCAMAYPDIQPWQVQRVDNDGNNDIYYQYLSLLLHPIDAETLRGTTAWCLLSVQHMKIGPAETREQHRSNFMCVVSRRGAQTYQRDLPHLLGLLMEIDDVKHAMAIANELVEKTEIESQPSTCRAIVETVNAAKKGALRVERTKEAETMKSILSLFEKTQKSKSTAINEMFDVPVELLSFICDESLTQGGDGMQDSQRRLVHFLAAEAGPLEVLEALRRLHSSDQSRDADLLEVTQTLLQRAAHESVSSEMSITLMKVKHARMDNEQCFDIFEADVSTEDVDGLPGETIWQSMSNGMLALAK